MNMKRTKFVSICLLLAMLLLSACGAPAPQSGSEAAAPADDTAAPAPAPAVAGIPDVPRNRTLIVAHLTPILVAGDVEPLQPGRYPPAGRQSFP